MICTKNIVCNIDSVPNEWIYLYYTSLSKETNFNGDAYKTKSPIPRIVEGEVRMEKDPSFSIFLKGDTYRWKDHALGISGSAIDLVKKIFNLDYRRACDKIVKDYNEYIVSNGDCYLKPIVTERQARKVRVEEVRREWNILDKGFWSPYHFSFKYLEESLILPLSEYTIIKGESDSTTIKGEYIYGFYSKAGDLFKIYQPKVEGYKYITVKSHLANNEFNKGASFCALCSGYKDCRALDLLKLDVDSIAGNSEKSYLPADIVNDRKKKYKKVITIMDSDKTGIEAMEEYKRRYDLDYVILPTKDVADLIKEKGITEARNILTILINKVLCT